MRTSTRSLVALTATLALAGAACGSDDDDSTTTDAPPATEAAEAPTTDAMDDEAMEDDAMEDEAMEDEAMEDEAMEDDAMAEDPTGPLCSAVPTDGEGSFAGITDDPAGTAASNNPALSTLVAAVVEAELVDTLNSDGPFTIFAPANPAFEVFTQEEIDALLADTETLTTVLTYHVVAGEKLASGDLVGMDSVTTVQGGDITLSVEADSLVLNEGQATVGCADVQTANAVVHIIDGVLMPA